MINGPEGAAEQPRGLEPGQPVPPDVAGKGRERWKYPLWVVSGVSALVATLGSGIYIGSSIPTASLEEAAAHAALVGISTMAALFIEVLFFGGKIDKLRGS